MEEVWKSLGLPHRPGGQASKHPTVRYCRGSVDLRSWKSAVIFK